MAVTNDELELPLFVADDVYELARKYNVAVNTIYTAIYYNKGGRNTGRKFVKVADEEE